MLLHESAVYLNEHNEWVQISHRMLSDEKLRAELRNQILFDSKLCRKELGIGKETRIISKSEISWETWSH